MMKQSAKIVVEETGISYFAWSIITDGFFNLPYYRKFMGKPLRLEIMQIKKGHGQWSVSLKNLDELTKSSVDRIKSGKYPIKEIYRLHQIYGSRVLASSAKLLRYLSNFEAGPLLKDLRASWNDFLHLNCLGTVLVWTDIDNGLFTENLKEILISKQVSSDKLQPYLSLLVSQDRPSLQWQENIELLKIASAYKTYRAAVTSSKFKSHCQKYTWIQYGFHGPVVGEEYFAKRMRKIFKGNTKQELKKQINHFSEVKKKQSDLEKKLKLSKKELSMFACARMIMYLKSYRVDVRYYFHWVADQIFRYLGKKYQAPYKWFIYTERKNIIDLVKGKRPNIDRDLIRAIYLLRVKDGISTKFFNIRDGESFLRKVIVTAKIGSLKEIVGNVAYPGLVKGTAKIVRSTKDISKVKKGDILVAMATNPDLLPAMFKAGAFITDAGGITSHAAIVAREMKKPCIIGTKVATRAIKDGDSLLVDATTGLIKIL